MTHLWQAPHAPSHLLASPPAVRRTRFVWGNMITALAASQNAVRGPHPQRLRIDEADEMLLVVLDAAQGQPMDRAGVQAQTVISSTHQHPDGTMTTVLQRAAARDWPVYEWCYRDTLEPHGWLTQAQVDRKRAEVPEQTWLSEYDLQEPSAEGRAIDSAAVDWTFDPQRGTGGAAQLDQGWEGEAPADAAEAYYAHGADWGQAIDYTVIVTLRCDVRPLPLVAAYRSRRRPWPVMIGVLNDRMARYPGGAAHDHTGGGRVVGEYVTAPILDVDMVGQRRRDLFIDYFAAIERHEITAPRVEPFYSEHRFCRVDDVFGSGHPPDTVVAMALAYHAFREARASPAITGSRSDEPSRRPTRTTPARCARGAAPQPARNRPSVASGNWRGHRPHGPHRRPIIGDERRGSPRGPGCRSPPRQPSGRRHHATI